MGVKPLRIKKAALPAAAFLLVLLFLGLGPALGQSAQQTNTSTKTGSTLKPAASPDTPGARPLFAHKGLGWDTDTLHYVYRQTIALPARLPELAREIMKQSRVLGVAGSIIVFLFILAIAYGLIGRKHVLAWIERLVCPVSDRLPKEIRPYFIMGLQAVTSALPPLLLLGTYYLIYRFIAYEAPWFLFVGELLWLWAAGALLLSLANGLRDFLINFRDEEAVKKMFRWLRPVVLYILFAVGVSWGADTFNFRGDFLALLHFVASVSIVIVVFLFLLNKKGVLSLLPRLPYSGYRKFQNALNRFYFPLIVLTFITGLLWSFGFERFSGMVLKKTWAIIGVFVAFSVIYHLVISRVKDWTDRLDTDDEDAQSFARSLKSLILYVTVVVAALIMLNLLGLLEPMSRLLSFTLFTVGKSHLSMWLLVKAVLIIVIFVYLASLMSSYLNYRIYPTLGVEPGFAYAINTFLKYFMLLVGTLVALQVVGFDLRALYVFAGAIGIGLGFAMQTVASNIISGFVIIFGAKIRKGDWIEVEGTLGVVTDIFLRATKVRTRANIEYIVPNNTLMSTTIVNYSLSSPIIRVDVPFGVSYSADPRVVSKVVLKAAAKEPSVMVHRRPEIRFVGYGDSSINFEVLIWIDIRKTARRLARSRLYYAMFDALAEAGIEIPFPQRDLHLRTGFKSHSSPDDEKKPVSDKDRMPDRTNHPDPEVETDPIKK